MLGFRVLVSSLPLQNGLGDAVTLDWTAFAAALGLSVLVGLGVAVAPVRDLLRGRLKGLGNQRGVRGDGARHRARSCRAGGRRGRGRR
jgi:hypothetical protein